MKTISAKTAVALLTATLGVSAVVPVWAQDAAPATQQAQPAEPTVAPPAPGLPGGPRHGGGFRGMLGFERGAEGVEIALVRLSHAIDLTDEQQTLFDTLKSDALAAAETFETATESLRPQPPVEGQEVAAMPDMSERLENRIAMTEAQLAALQAVQPSYTAFFDSLTDAQKAQLVPERGERGGPRGPHDGGPHHGGPGGRPMGGPNRG